MAGHTSWVRREPIGVCAQVTPWNYPLLMAMWKISPGSAAGNTVVLKPSDTTPMSTLLLAEVAQEFFPAGVFNVVCGDRDTGRALVDSKIPAMASITGFGRAGMAGRRVRGQGRQAGVHLELGGKVLHCSSATPTSTQPSRASVSAGLQCGEDCTAATRRNRARERYDASLRSSNCGCSPTPRPARLDDEDVPTARSTTSTSSAASRVSSSASPRTPP